MDNQSDNKKYIFGSLFLLVNKLQAKGDQWLAGKEGMTLRQWFLTAMIMYSGERTPALGEVADLMGTSHQNAKQVANKLEKNGFIEFSKDMKDRRVLRLTLTKKSTEFWKEQEGESNEFLTNLFYDLTEEELAVTKRVINKMITSLENLNK
ncbi:MarR family winged helix-turn-helix transcriptional regulator [Salipaludibacillus aurantiacus]|uniref:DNA-binding transcriptional regulator, MarR family n=1 Tax=Salipaludibacillus aurantiacus TaxID=1601833 RepID=A0A1H9VZU8_9BACI|nr:MarR family transcriptional regulator [Salipaludibacillus aurantiacus]SES27098.1 DNA-binding transcriptional regulator, MarR family [Salipaludibacillus aurantiacus]